MSGEITPDTILVTTVDHAASAERQGSVVVAAPAQALVESYNATITALEAAFAASAAQSIGTLLIDEITVSLSVSADGRVSILGSGAAVSGAASIQLKFSRQR